MHESLQALLSCRIAAAISAVTGNSVNSADAGVRPSTDARFGDYQCNAAMVFAKSLTSKPRDVAERIVAAATPLLADIAEPLEVAGPGFINIRLRDEFLQRCLGGIPAPGADDDRLGIEPARQPQTIVIDYSSPNIAKQMHVGHLRSTIIGDVFARLLAFEGHRVIRQNHVGDWGTAIGMVVVGLWYIETRVRRGEDAAAVEARIARLANAETGPPAEIDALGTAICRDWTADLQQVSLDQFVDDDITLDQLELGYRFVQALTAAAAGRAWRITGRDGAVENLADIPRKVTRMMQAGGAANESERKAWQKARAISLRYCDQVYRRLGVLLTEADVCGESFYERDQRLPKVVAELERRLPSRDRSQPAPGAYAEFRLDAGAKCVFLYDANHQPRFRNAEGHELPLMVQKSDGAYLYATTDLAALRYRIGELGGRRLIYVTGAPQKLHFQMFFAVARAAGWVAEGVTLEHVTFGSVLGDNRKPLKTRSGENVKLGDLLDEAEARAAALLAEKLAAEPPAYRDSFAAGERREIARRIGIGSVKYFDLARDRNGDYVFNWGLMLALQGNTAPYMLYAYARIRSIYRKAAATFGEPDVYAPAVALVLADPAERALALRLLRFREALDSVAAELLPHILCGYVYDLATEFMRFYEACPVVQAPDEPTRLSRMRLCDLTARTLQLGLGLLGIEVVERM